MGSQHLQALQPHKTPRTLDVPKLRPQHAQGDLRGLFQHPPALHHRQIVQHDPQVRIVDNKRGVQHRENPLRQ